MKHVTLDSPGVVKQRPTRRLWRWLKRIALSAVLLVGVTLVAGLIYQTTGAAADARNYPPPGTLVSVGDYSLHLYCTGEGTPTVILETMAGGTSPNWGWIQPEIARVTRVCAYDRAGRGWSESGPPPADLWGTAEDLHTLLRNAGVGGPYVLVGHSIGGLYVRAFAAQHPEEVVGIALVDSVHPDKYDRYPEYAAADEAYARIASIFPALARIGLFRLYLASGGEIDFQDLPPRQHAELAAFWSSPSYFQNSNAEGQTSIAIHQQGRSLPDLGDMPLVVISAGIQSPSWTSLQAELPSLSTNGTHIVVADATHASLAFNPGHAQQTSAAILQLVAVARTPVQ